MATAVGAMPEAAANGLLVPPGDPEALAAALLAVLEDPALAHRLGESARRDALDWERIARAILDAYRPLLAQPVPAEVRRTRETEVPR